MGVFDITKANELHRLGIVNHIEELNRLYGTNFKESVFGRRVNEMWNSFVESPESDRAKAFDEHFRLPMLRLRQSMLSELYAAHLSKTEEEQFVQPEVYSHRINQLFAYALEAYTDYTKDKCAEQYAEHGSLHMQFANDSPADAFRRAMQEMETRTTSGAYSAPPIHPVVPVYADDGSRYLDRWMYNYTKNVEQDLLVRGNIQKIIYEQGAAPENAPATDDETVFRHISHRYSDVGAVNEAQRRRNEEQRRLAEQARLDAIRNDPERIAAEEKLRRDMTDLTNARKRNPFPRMPLNSAAVNTPDHLGYVEINKFNEKHGTALQLEGLMNEIRALPWSAAYDADSKFAAAYSAVYKKIVTAAAVAAMDAAVKEGKLSTDGVDLTRAAIEANALLETVAGAYANHYSQDGKDYILSSLAYGTSANIETGLTSVLKDVISEAKEEYLAKSSKESGFAPEDAEAVSALNTEAEGLSARMAELDALIASNETEYTAGADALYESYAGRSTADIVASAAEAREHATSAPEDAAAKTAALEAAYALERRIDRRYGWWMPRLFRASSYNKCKNELASIKEALGVENLAEALKESRAASLGAERAECERRISEIGASKEAMRRSYADKLFADKTDYALIEQDKQRSRMGYERGEDGITVKSGETMSRGAQLGRYISENMPTGGFGADWGEYGPESNAIYSGKVARSPYTENEIPAFAGTADTDDRDYMSEDERRIFANVQINRTDVLLTKEEIDDKFDYIDPNSEVNDIDATIARNREMDDDGSVIEDSVSEIGSIIDEEEEFDPQRQEMLREREEFLRSEREREEREELERIEEQRRKEELEREAERIKAAERERVEKLKREREKKDAALAKQKVEGRKKQFLDMMQKEFNKADRAHNTAEEKAKAEEARLADLERKLFSDLSGAEQRAVESAAGIDKAKAEIALIQLDLMNRMTSSDLSDQKREELSRRMSEQMALHTEKIESLSAEKERSEEEIVRLNKALEDCRRDKEQLDEQRFKDGERYVKEIKFRSSLKQVSFTEDGTPILPEGVQIPEHLKGDFSGVFAEKPAMRERLDLGEEFGKVGGELSSPIDISRNPVQKTMNN